MYSRSLSGKAHFFFEQPDLVLTSFFSVPDTYFRCNISRGLGELGITDLFQRPGVESVVDDWFMGAEGKEMKGRCVSSITEVRRLRLCSRMG